jgi:hypothetical protein
LTLRDLVDTKSSSIDPTSVEITVRDGQAGHAVDTDGKGLILGKTQAEDFLDMSDAAALPDGTKVVVIGSEETMGEYRQTVFVGSMR